MTYTAATKNHQIIYGCKTRNRWVLGPFSRDKP